MSYQGQSMPDYIDGYEEILNRLAAMDSAIPEDLQVAMLLASFGDKNRSPYGHTVASLQSSQETLTWEAAAARLLQEYDENVSRLGSASTPKGQEQGRALAANSSGSKRQFGKMKGRRFTEKRRCFKCHKVGHIAKNCTLKYKKKYDESSEALHYQDEGEGHAQNAQLLFASAKQDRTESVKTVSGREVTDCGQSRQEPVHVRCFVCFKEGHSYNNCRNYHGGRDRTYLSDDDENHTAAVASSAHKTKAYTDFLLDSGASDHMVSDKRWLQDFEAIEPRVILLGNGSRVFATHRGTLKLTTLVGKPGDMYIRQLTFRKVLFVPELKSNLISCSMLCDEGYTVNFNATKCVGLHDGSVQFQGRKSNGVYKINRALIHATCGNAHVAQSTQNRNESGGDMGLWHARLGHAHPERIRRLLRSNAVTGLDLRGLQTVQKNCSGCMKGKQTKESLKPNKSRATKKCAVVHADVCGPMPVTSHSGARYFVCFVDDYSGHKTVIPISRKSDVRSNFIWYHAWLERKFDCSIKRLHYDIGGEFIALAGYLKDKGIGHTMTPSYSPNLNGVAERANRTIVEVLEQCWNTAPCLEGFGQKL